MFFYKHYLYNVEKKYIDIIGSKDRWTNRIFSKIKINIREKTYIALRNKEILHFLVSHSFFFLFKRSIIKDRISISNFRWNEFCLKSETENQSVLD